MKFGFYFRLLPVARKTQDMFCDKILQYCVGTLNRGINAFNHARFCTMSVTTDARVMMNVDLLVPLIWIHVPVIGMGRNLYSIFCLVLPKNNSHY